MSDIRLIYKGGVDAELTLTANRQGWSAANCVRFREGAVERIRGWVSACNQILSGAARTMHFWSDLLSVLRVSVGTSSTLYLIDQDSKNAFDITPAGLLPGPASSGTVPYSLRIYSMDNFGQILMAVPSGGTLYAWTPPTLTTPAVVVPTAPPHNQGCFTTAPQRILMMFGSSPDGGSQDPMLLRWSDMDDYTTWDPTTTNFAGSFRLSRGNRIIGALQGPLNAYIFTDQDIWIIQYEGFPLVFGFFQLTSQAGLISQNAAVVLGTSPYWMSDHGFFTLGGGGAQQIPCTVWDKVFLDLDEANQDKIVAMANYHYGEIGWAFPSLSGGTGENDSFVKYNIQENLWDYGGPGSALARTAWTDWNRPGGPLSVDSEGNVWHQDVGFMAGKEPLPGAMITSGFNDLDDGSSMIFIDRLIPDFRMEGDDPQIQLNFMVRDYPGGPITTAGPFTITPSTEFVNIWLRGREWAEQIIFDGASWARRGVPRIRISRDGRL